MIALAAEGIGIGTWLVVGLLVAAAVAARHLLSPAARLRREQLRLHGKLAAANGLSEDEAAALWRLASAAKLSEPAVAFVRPSLLDSGGLQGVGGDVVAALRAKLFGH